MVSARASLVADISRTAAAISVVELDSPCTVPSCCLAVAAICEEVESNCTLPSRTSLHHGLDLGNHGVYARRELGQLVVGVDLHSCRQVAGPAGHFMHPAQELSGRLGDAPRGHPADKRNQGH